VVEVMYHVDKHLKTPAAATDIPRL